MHHVESESDCLDLGDDLALVRIRECNQQEMQNRFPSFLARAYGWCLEYPSHWSSPSKLHELFTLIRLFRPGTVSFIANARSQQGRWIEIPAYLILSYLPETPLYRIEDADCARFACFCRAVRQTESWNSHWAAIARAHFLQASSARFSLERSTLDPWAFLRPLGYVMALEACLVPDEDLLISRRLRKRAVALLGLASEGREARELQKRIGRMYGIRSAVAHGRTLNSEHRQVLRKHMPAFEEDVRKLLWSAVRNIPAGDDRRTQHMRRRYCPSDDDRMAELARLAGEHLEDQDLRAKVKYSLGSCRETLGRPDGRSKLLPNG